MGGDSGIGGAVVVIMYASLSFQVTWSERIDAPVFAPNYNMVPSNSRGTAHGLADFIGPQFLPLGQRDDIDPPIIGANNHFVATDHRRAVYFATGGKRPQRFAIR